MTYHIITLYILNLQMLYINNISIKLEGKEDAIVPGRERQLAIRTERKSCINTGFIAYCYGNFISTDNFLKIKNILILYNT